LIKFEGKRLIHLSGKVVVQPALITNQLQSNYKSVLMSREKKNGGEKLGNLFKHPRDIN
jgi:hypothetical protein